MVIDDHDLGVHAQLDNGDHADDDDDKKAEEIQSVHIVVDIQQKNALQPEGWGVDLFSDSFLQFLHSGWEWKCSIEI